MLGRILRYARNNTELILQDFVLLAVVVHLQSTQNISGSLTWSRRQ